MKRARTDLVDKDNNMASMVKSLNEEWIFMNT